MNLFDPACPVKFVITVQALKEGWDCSFAYIFCSLATVHSAKDVEQLLGRVLRMPYARRRQAEELNRAYAHVSSASWPAAIVQLRDRLVNMGFDETEAERASLREQVAIRRRQEKRRNCPAEKGVAFEVPQLMIRLDGALYPIDAELYLREGVRLADLPVALDAADFEAENRKKYRAGQGQRFSNAAVFKRSGARGRVRGALCIPQGRCLHTPEILQGQVRFSSVKSGVDSFQASSA